VTRRPEAGAKASARDQWAHADGDRCAVLAVAATRDGIKNCAERIVAGVEQNTPAVGQPDFPGRAGKEAAAQFLLQQLDLMADRLGSDQQLLGGSLEAQMPGSSLESLAGVQWRKIAAHGFEQFILM